jgi:hypothetical protein
MITAMAGLTGMKIMFPTASQWKEGWSDPMKDGTGILIPVTASLIITGLSGKTITITPGTET